MSIFSFLVLQNANSFLNHVLEKNSSVMKLIVCSVEKFFVELSAHKKATLRLIIDYESLTYSLGLSH